MKRERLLKVQDLKAAALSEHKTQIRTKDDHQKEGTTTSNF
jgi:hypothetical protein